jgi:hypothetical protein
MRKLFLMQIVIFSLVLILTQNLRAQQLLQSFIGEATNNYFGGSVSGAGDVNGDGYDDVIIGATGYNATTGRVYIYFGSNSTVNTPNVIMTGEGTNNQFGISVSGAGDVNGDGYDDVIIGANSFNSYTGRAYIYFGGSSMDNIADIIMTGEDIDDEFGCSVSGAGDVNHDGYDDVIVGARGYYSSSTGIGRAYIYYGGSSMNSKPDVIMTGEETFNYFGHSVSGAGDVNGDGYDDVIVGAYGYNSLQGRVYIYYGGSIMNNTADVTMVGEGTNSDFGVSVSSAGDVNRDGYDDVIVGAYRYDSWTGRAYIYYGGSTMDSLADVTMTGEGTNNYFGGSVSESGDVNKDGYDDVIVGANRYNSNTGRAYIYFGGNNMNGTADIIMTGQGIGDYFGRSVSKIGDFNKDGYNDVIVSASRYNSNTGQAYIYTFVSTFVVQETGIPTEYKLNQNYPNPFNPSTKIQYAIPKEEYVNLKVYNISGKEVATLVNEYKHAGFYEVKLELGSNASGVYFYSLKAGKFSQTNKMLYLK